jgi:DNA polymerase
LNVAELDRGTREALLERVRFYRDLGLTEFYRRAVNPALLEKLDAAQRAEAATPLLVPGSALTPESTEEIEIARRKPIVVPPAPASAPPANRAGALQILREEIGDCTRCPLHKGRNKLVFADGDPNARLMFVGEGPGADEDAQGLPFVGRAGQLLNNMIAAMGLKREEVYIANVVKCRPPGNRTPEPEEANTCSPFLFRQIDIVRPQVLVALGATAATYLLGTKQPLAGLRGRVHAVRGTQLIVTYHPAYLLRDPRQKKEAWADLQIAMKELGLKPPAR